MLTPEERRELQRCLKLRERRILTEDQATARLARIARRGKLDDILAHIPPVLVGPLETGIDSR